MKLNKLLFFILLICLTPLLNCCAAEPAPRPIGVWIPEQEIMLPDHSIEYIPGHWQYPTYYVSPLSAFFRIGVNARVR